MWFAVFEYSEGKRSPGRKMYIFRLCTFIIELNSMLITNDLHPLIQKSSCALWGMQHMSSKLVTICFSERTVPQPFPFSVSINGSLLKQSGLTIYSAFVEGFVKGRVIFGFLLILCILFLKGFRQLFLLENFTSESMSKSLPSSWWKRQGHLPHNFFSQVCIGKINKNQGYKKTQPTFTTILLSNPLLYPITIPTCSAAEAERIQYW